ncbi:hypothetical protein CHKEEEPN_4770 [Methylorubrum podarium]|nr:hypothetical protein CHKEEEPN_4770 [Methylorubrum podarium]
MLRRRSRVERLMLAGRPITPVTIAQMRPMTIAATSTPVSAMARLMPIS